MQGSCSTKKLPGRLSLLLPSPPPMSDQLHWRRRAFAESALSRHIAGERGRRAFPLSLSSVSGGESRSSSENRRSLNINRSSALLRRSEGVQLKAQMHSPSTLEICNRKTFLQNMWSDVAGFIATITSVFTLRVFTNIHQEIGHISLFQARF